MIQPSWHVCLRSLSACSHCSLLLVFTRAHNRHTWFSLELSSLLYTVCTGAAPLNHRTNLKWPLERLRLHNGWCVIRVEMIYRLNTNAMPILLLYGFNWCFVYCCARSIVFHRPSPITSHLFDSECHRRTKERTSIRTWTYMRERLERRSIFETNRIQFEKDEHTENTEHSMNAQCSQYVHPS